jgi:CRP-like cAMP-binding protein
MVKESLPEIPIFQNLTRQEIDELSTWLRRLDLEPGKEVFAEGSPPDGLYVVARGRVEVLRTAEAGPCRVTELEGPCVFGEMALLSREPHSAGIRTLTNVTAGLLPLDVFEAKLAQNNVTALHIILHLGRVLCQRLRVTTDRLLEISELSAAQRATQAGKRRITRELNSLCNKVLSGEGDD